MTSILHFVDSLARVLVEALLNSLWQGLLIVALVWLLLRLSISVSATTRHAVWFVSLSALVVMPFFTGIRAWRRSQTVTTVSTTQTATRANVTTSLPLIAYQTVVPQFTKPAPIKAAPQAATGASSNSFSEPVKPAPETSLKVATPPAKQQASWLSQRLPLGLAKRWPLGLAALWLVGSTLMLARFAHSYIALVRLRRALTDVPADISQRMEWLSNVFGIRRTLRVTASATASMPMTIGWRKPLIILPQDLANTLTTAECDSVMAHELAHIKRHDYATNFAQRLVQCVFFFHPAVWLIGKQLVIERELACDDWAVKLTGEPRRYAGCLTKLVELLSESKPLLAATGILFGKHIITRRVEMILNRDRNATTSVSKPALAYAIALATFCIAICSTLSPVIAVPLVQRPQPVPAPKPAAPKTLKAPQPAPAPAAPLEFDDILELDAPLARIEINGEIIDVPPPAALADVMGEVQDHLLDLQHEFPVAIAPAAPLSPLSPISPLSEIAEWQQSGEKKAPAIPEDEMLKLLSDIVRRDADANVRAEALSGIYRLRSDAAINTLIQLYDQVSDPKTKGDILARLIRRNGDNSKALAKLVQVVKSEKDEMLVSRALSSLGYLKGDEGADQLVSIYDGLQDAKMKQRVIRSMGANKGKKAIEKLMAIAKNDSDPTLRQAALRALSNLDGGSFDLSTGVASPRMSFGGNGAFNLDGKVFELNQDRMRDIQRDAEERMRDAQERMRESQERMQQDMELRMQRRSRSNGAEQPAPATPPATEKKPTAASPKAAPKPATAVVVI